VIGGLTNRAISLTFTLISIHCHDRRVDPFGKTWRLLLLKGLTGNLMNINFIALDMR
jgi:hypothetical protein